MFQFRWYNQCPLKVYYEGFELPSRAYSIMEVLLHGRVSSISLLIACLSTEHFTLHHDEHLTPAYKRAGHSDDKSDDGLLSVICSKYFFPNKFRQRRRNKNTNPADTSCLGSVLNLYPWKTPNSTTQIHIHICRSQKFQIHVLCFAYKNKYVTKEKKEDGGESVPQ